MEICDIIAAKKSGELTKEQIDFFISGVVDGSVADYQASALLMACCLNGLSPQETYYLTQAMADSGEKADLSGISGVCVDKHSSGGVGDTTTLVVAPVAACAGLKMPKMSGRGLGHTGGTIDKLESIAGFNTQLGIDEFKKITDSIGVCVIGQTLNIAPADKKLYALRDVTATVDSTGLIAASIMSKKLAGGASNIVLDVKCGDGAFIKDTQNAVELAQSMIDIGKKAGKKVGALITDMQQPLSSYIGNGVEVFGAIEVLKGQDTGRLYQLSMELCAKIFEVSMGMQHAQALLTAKQIISSGKAYQKFVQMVEKQGGDTSYVEQPEKLVSARHTTIQAKSDGYADINTLQVGKCLKLLGGSRQKLGDSIDYKSGLKLLCNQGDKIVKGQSIIKVFSDKELDSCQLDSIGAAVSITDTANKARQLVYKSL